MRSDLEPPITAPNQGQDGRVLSCEIKGVSVGCFSCCSFDLSCILQHSFGRITALCKCESTLNFKGAICEISVKNELKLKVEGAAYYQQLVVLMSTNFVITIEVKSFSRRFFFLLAKTLCKENKITHLSYGACLQWLLDPNGHATSQNNMFTHLKNFRCTH